MLLYSQLQEVLITNPVNRFLHLVAMNVKEFINAGMGIFLKTKKKVVDYKVTGTSENQELCHISRFVSLRIIGKQGKLRAKLRS